MQNDKSIIFTIPRINNKVTEGELLLLQDELLIKLNQEKFYYLRNDAKIRAVYSTQSYDEFKDIVEAAHLTPITRQEKMDAKTKNRLWNTLAIAKEE